MMRSRFAKRLLWGCGGAVAVVALLLGAGYGFLQTDAGRDAAARVIERALSVPGEMEVRISGLRGALPQKVRAESITVGDARGVWLEIRNAALDWRPLALISGAVRADLLGAETIRVLRRPGDSGGGDGDAGSSLKPILGTRIDRIAIDRIILEQPVLGTSAAFSASGHLAAVEDHRIVTSLAVQRTDGVDGSLHAKAQYDITERRLDIDLKAEEPPSGLAARALGLPDLPAVSVSLSGAGPLTGWRGELRIDLDGLAGAEAEFAITGDGPYVFAARGKADVARVFDEPLRRFARGAVSFDATASWAPATERLALSRLDLASETISVNAAGAIELDSREIEATADVRPLEPGLLRGLADPVEVELARASVTVRGPLDRPGLDVLAVLGGVRAPPLTSGRGEVRLSADPRRGSQPPRWSVDVRAGLSQLVFDDPPLAGLLGDSASATLSGDVAPADGTLADASFELAAGHVTARGGGKGNFLSGAAKAGFTIAVDDLAPLAPIVSMPLRGSLALQTRVSAGEIGVTARVTGGFDDLDTGEALVASLFGASPAIGGSVLVEPSGLITISDAAIEGRGARAEIGTMTLDGDRIDGTYGASVVDLSAAAKAMGADAGGTVKTEGRVSGPIDDPTVEGTVEASALRWQDRMLGSAKGHYAVRTVASAPIGKISLDANTPAGSFIASTGVAMPPTGAVRLQDLSIKGEGISIAGRLDIPVGEGAVAGRLQGDVSRFEHWTALVGAPVAGSAGFDLRLHAKDGRQAADLRVDAKNFAPAPDVEIARLTAEISATDLETGPRARVRLDASDARLAGGSLAKLSFTGEGALDSFSAEFSAKGDIAGPLDVTGRASADLQKNLMRVTLSSLSGSVAGSKIAMKEPGLYAEESGRVSVSLPSLSWGDAAIAVSGDTDGRTISGHARIQRLSAATLSAFLPGFSAKGRLDAELELSGAADDPSGKLRVALEGVKVDGGDTSNLPPLTGAVTGILHQGRLEVDGEVTGLGKAALHAQADIPVRLAFAPLAFGIPPHQRMDARLSWNGDIAPVAAVLPLSDHRLSGVMDVSLKAGGTLSEPVLDGSVVWSNGRYENIVTGTVLANIDMRARLEDEEIVLQGLTATDGAQGRLSGKGVVRLDGGANASVDANLTMRQFTMLRRDDVTATVSGELSAKGAPEDLKIAGRIQTDRVEAYLVDSLPPGVVKLDVVEVNGRHSPGASTEQKPAPSVAPPVALDITVTMPRRVYLRGRGLDSEWAGDIRVTGSTDSPVLKGELRPVRGRFDLAGRIFKLNESGRVYFDGAAKIDPRLDISAAYQTSALTATVRIEGTASQPKISLSSVPEMPRDEILSRILFDKSVGQLSPGEAVQLASAVATLTGITGGGPGILDRVRNELGVDALRLGEDDEGNTTVGVGKYLTDDVYVGVDRGPTQKSGNVSVEVTVIPNVTVKTDVGADARSRVGINWRWNY